MSIPFANREQIRTSYRVWWDEEVSPDTRNKPPNEQVIWYIRRREMSYYFKIATYSTFLADFVAFGNLREETDPAVSIQNIDSGARGTVTHVGTWTRTDFNVADAESGKSVVTVSLRTSDTWTETT